jgi:hypothetical protein
MSAADLVRDIRSLGTAGADDVRAGTLHSECFRILGRNDVIEITGRHPRPLSAFEFEPMLADLRVSASGRNKRQRRKLVSAYESAWARLQHENPGAPLTADDQQFEDALIDWLRFHRAMLIGELVPFAYKYLRDNPTAPERSAYTHVLVDRRLLFVGLTRVKSSPQEGRPGHLIMSASRTVPTGIAMRSGIAIAGQDLGASRTITSRFLAELGPDCPAPQAPIA